MSFTRTLTARTLPLIRTRAFATSPFVRKSAVDQAKEAAQNVVDKSSNDGFLIQTSTPFLQTQVTQADVIPQRMQQNPSNLPLA